MKFVIKCDYLGKNMVSPQCYRWSVTGKMTGLDDCVACIQSCKKLTLE